MDKSEESSRASELANIPDGCLALMSPVLDFIAGRVDNSNRPEPRRQRRTLSKQRTVNLVECTR
jgi:hypothetical protein